MKIGIKIYPSLKQHIPQAFKHLAKLDQWEVPEGATVSDLEKMLGISPVIPVAVAVNASLNRNREMVLQDGDQVSFQPVMTGG